MFWKKEPNPELEGMDRLNIGCGDHCIRDWLNISLWRNEEIPYGTTKKIRGAVVLHFDVTNGLPLPRNSVKYVYASHFIEHLKFQEGIKFLKRCHKVMKKDGIIRLTFPDLEMWIRNYYEDNMKFFRDYSRLVKPYNEISGLKTKGEIFMSQVHNWGHKWNYDAESMKHILEKAKFRETETRKMFESRIPDIRKIEPSNPTRLLETAYVEAVK